LGDTCLEGLLFMSTKYFHFLRWIRAFDETFNYQSFKIISICFFLKRDKNLRFMMFMKSLQVLEIICITLHE